MDSSAEMNTLADLLLRDGDPDKEMALKGVFFRQFLPASQTVSSIVMDVLSTEFGMKW